MSKEPEGCGNGEGDVLHDEADESDAVAIRIQSSHRVWNITHKLTAFPLFPVLILSMTINVHTAPNCPKPQIANRLTAGFLVSTTGAKNATSTVNWRSRAFRPVYRIKSGSSVPGNFGSS